MYIYKYIIFKTISVFQKDTRIACFFSKPIDIYRTFRPTDSQIQTDILDMFIAPSTERELQYGHKLVRENDNE